MSVRIGINGFGRIGRIVFRVALDHPEIEVVAINDLTDSATMAYLLKYDSVHGTLEQEVKAEEGRIVVGDQSVVMTSVRDPADLNWEEHGTDIVAECTGLFRDRESASKHLAAGARKEIIFSPIIYSKIFFDSDK